MTIKNQSSLGINICSVLSEQNEEEDKYPPSHEQRCNPTKPSDGMVSVPWHQNNQILTHPRLSGGKILLRRTGSGRRWQVLGYQSAEGLDYMGIGKMLEYELELRDWDSDTPELIGKDED